MCSNKPFNLQQCCGTREIDRVEDWSYFLNTTDFPATCCSKKQKAYAKSLELIKRPENEIVKATQKKPETNIETSYCGRGLARTRTKSLGFHHNLIFKRVYSGFFLSLTQFQKEKLKAKFKAAVEHETNDQIVHVLDAATAAFADLGAGEVFNKIWKNFYADHVCNTLEYQGKIQPAQNDENSPDRKTACTDTLNIADYNDLAYPVDVDIKNKINHVGVIKNVSKLHEDCMTVWVPFYRNTKAKAPHLLLHNKLGSAPPNGTFDWRGNAFCHDVTSKWKENATTIGRQLLLQLDYLTTYIYELATPRSIASSKVNKKAWVLWPIDLQFSPTDLYPCKN